MGIYDTIIFDKPIICPTCGDIIKNIQTKELDPSMSYYRKGDYIQGILDKLFKEEVFCWKEKKVLEDIPIYITIKKGILVGIERTYEDAIKTAENFEEKIYQFLIDNYKEKVKVKRNFNQLTNDIYHLKDYYEKFTNPKYEKMLSFFEIFQENYRNNNIIKNLNILLENAKEIIKDIQEEE